MDEYVFLGPYGDPKRAVVDAIARVVASGPDPALLDFNAAPSIASYRVPDLELAGC